MARFILDVDTENIQSVMEVLDRDKILLSTISSIRCIDESNDNQFYDEGECGTNRLSSKQIQNDRAFFPKEKRAELVFDVIYEICEKFVSTYAKGEKDLEDSMKNVKSYACMYNEWLDDIIT